MGVIRTEAIQVVAEAYDVAVDMSFPKGRFYICYDPNFKEDGRAYCFRLVRLSVRTSHF